MEVHRDQMTQEKWEEFRNLAKNNVCAECDADLQVHTVPETSMVRIGCLDRAHRGWIEKTTLTQEMRRGAELPAVIKDSIEKHLMPREDLNRAMNLLALRYPKAILDPPTAALFLVDCQRLGLDPLIAPAEAVPIPFRSKPRDGKEKVTVQMIITEDGYFSMAARGCPEEWDGAPANMPLLDYLLSLPEHKGRPLEEVVKIAARTAEELSGENTAYVWVALGRRKSSTQLNPVFGWYTQTERQDALNKRLPAGANPGNQARIRANKRWVRENFAEARQNMIGLTREWRERSAGIKEAEAFIDAEYSFLSLPPAGDKTGASRGGHKKDMTLGGAEIGATVLSPKGQENQNRIGRSSAERRRAHEITVADLPDGYSLEKIANELWRLQPATLWAELNYSSVRNFQDANIESAWECFLKLKSVREEAPDG